MRAIYRYLSRLVIVLALSLFGATQPVLPARSLIPAQGPTNSPAGIYFDDSSPDHLRLGNSDFELTLSKTNGAILTLVDKAANASLMLGSRGGCLWGSVFNSMPTYVGGCSYSASAASSFTYSWNAANAALSLSYQADRGGSRPVDTTVVLTVAPQSYFDMRLTLLNQGREWIRNVILPSDLSFISSAVQAAYAPFLLPGVRLRSGFFTSFLPTAADQRYQYVPTYPSDAAFADYLALDVAGGHFAVYTVNPNSPIQPVALGFVDDSVNRTNTFFTYHSFHTWIPDGGTYTSPTVRIRVGQSPQASILAYRSENGIAAYPSVADKLGSRFDVVAHAPLIRADIWRINKRFTAWIPDLDRLPVPSLVHPVAFEPGGHDTNYPDFLPPDSRWGTTADFRAMVAAAHARHLLVMPYINPTWWNDGSPTLRHLPTPLTAADIAVRGENGQPVYETYNGHGGYVVSPFVPFVQQRLARLMAQWRDEVPVDFVFEDQIGARVWQRDLNPAAPNTLAYSDGWLAHVDSYASQGLMTEQGWDRLARKMIGFHGSLLTWAREFNYDVQNWGAGNWEPYPLALWLLHDKVLLYQHDLDDQTMTHDLGVLTWNVAFGMMLSYDWQWADNAPLDNPWLDLVAAMQRSVAARYAGRPLTDFSYLQPDVTRTTFDNLAVVANWNPMLTYAVEGHRIAPGGYLVTTIDRSVLAGVFTEFFNNSELSAGEHYLVIERTAQALTVSQPIGAETVLAISLPAGWQPNTGLHVWAVGRNGQRLGEIAHWADGPRLKFHYSSTWHSQPVSRYDIMGTAAKSNSIFLPYLR